MKKQEFKISDYINYHYQLKNNKVLVDNDKFETEKESLYKNIRNFLLNFNKDFNLIHFDFNNNVFNYFPLYSLKNEEINQFLEHILTLKSKDELVGNKTISNIKNLNTNAFDINEFYITSPIKSYFQNSLDKVKQDYRNIVRKKISNANLIIEIFDEIIAELQITNNPSDLGAIVDLTADITLQMFNYWVITLDGLENDNKLIIVNEIEKYLQKFDDKLNANQVNSNSKIILSDSVITFVEFYKKYSNWSQYTNISNMLLEEELDSPDYFKEIKDEYKVKKGTSYKLLNYKNIICEGENINAFKDKFINTQKAIEIFQNNGVNASNIDDLFDIKVYFREIYISNSKYKTKASTIIRKMNVNSISQFEKHSEYLFLREKITRGYFRELSLLEFYHIKIKIQKQIHKILLKIMLSYNYNDSLDYLQEFINDMTPLCFTAINEYKKNRKM